MTDYLDQKRIRRAFDRAAPEFDSKDFLNRDIDQRLAARLDLIAIDPGVVVDVGAGTTTSTMMLRSRYPGARLVAIDSAPKMLSAGVARTGLNCAACADSTALPLRDSCVDLVFSSLMLPFCPDPMGTLAEMRRVLRHPGALLLSSLGPDTLIELQCAWREVDRYHHVLPFMDMHDLGDALVHAGFAEPVLDAELLTVTYRDLDAGMADLRAAGSINAATGRNPGLTGRNSWQRMTKAYEKQRSEDGRLPATIEVIFALAWAGEIHPTRRADGTVEVPLERLRRRRD